MYPPRFCDGPCGVSTEPLTGFDSLGAETIQTPSHLAGISSPSHSRSTGHHSAAPRGRRSTTCRLPLASLDEIFPPVNRIVERFARLKREGQKGFVVYIGAGDPSLEATRELALAFDRLGVDVLELGVPFSDPLADGLVNQMAAQRGLASGTTPAGVLKTVALIRQESQIPVVLYIYFNLIHRYGLERFVDDAARAGVDGLLVLDLPPEEGEHYEALMGKAELCNVYLVAPTTPDERIEFIVKRGRGFIYYVSREGVTGMQAKVADTIAQMTAKIRAHTTLPIAVGFGISTPEQARLVAANAEAVVVGSAIVSRIAEHGGKPNLAGPVAEFAASLLKAVKST
jgi:tryptophan synthase alpha chain